LSAQGSPVSGANGGAGGGAALDLNAPGGHAAGKAAALLQASLDDDPVLKGKGGRRSVLGRLRAQLAWEHASRRWFSRPADEHPHTPQRGEMPSTPIVPPVTPSAAGGTPLSPVLSPRVLEPRFPLASQPLASHPATRSPAALPSLRPSSRPPLKLDAIQSVEVSSFHEAEFMLTHCGSPRLSRDPSAAREGLVFRAASTAAMCAWVSLLTEVIEAKASADRERRFQTLRALPGGTRTLPQRVSAVGARGGVHAAALRRSMANVNEGAGRTVRKIVYAAGGL